MKRIVKAAVTVLGLAAVMGPPASANACGGFFCSQAQPVNQAAERIVFATNSNGTVTAAIQILYEGPSEKFSWLLPISSVPQGDEIALASNLAFQRLQTATNPNYTLTTRVEGTCRVEDFAGGFGSGGSASGAFGGSGGGGPASTPGGVTVEASGILGSFEWTVISLDASLAEPADAAVQWLANNGYDVPPGAPRLLGPYLQDDMYLLALRLTKGSDVGSIRPIVLTYAGTKPSIPVKLTAVAANEDMGVMAWLLADAQAVPQNYLSLELNEARIDWFNASRNYNNLVVQAADDAGGQGFVTEFAGPASPLAQLVFSDAEEAQWDFFKKSSFQSFQAMFETSLVFSQYDGFWDAVRGTVTLPAGVSFPDFQACPSCYAGEFTLSPAAFIAGLEKSVIEPMRRVRDLLLAHPTATRLYTTLSADEMTLDPLFTFNPDLPEVSNQHNAERIIECSPSYYQREAPWRIELPQGGVVRGGASQIGTWPAELSAQPPNRRILRHGESGSGKVIEDNSEAIVQRLDDYNGSLGLPTPSGIGNGSGGRSSGTGGRPGVPGNGGSPAASPSHTSTSGCSLAKAAGRSAPWNLAALAAILAIGWRRRASRIPKASE